MKRNVRPYSQAFLDLYACAFALTFSEWVFFESKPSFFSALTAMQQVMAGTLSAYWLVLVASLGFGILVLGLQFLPRQILGQVRTAVLTFFPTVLLSILIFLLVDNLFYSAFSVGIMTLDWGQSLVTFLWALTVLCWVWRRKIKAHENPWGVLENFRYGFFICTFAACPLFFLSAWLATGQQNGSSPTEIVDKMPRRPHIIFFGIDGVNADNTSFYGYVHKTTPNLDRLKAKAFYAENAFANASFSLGSITSMLTGKLATETKVFRAGDRLLGMDTEEHLPSILKKRGYVAHQFAEEPYAGSGQIGMQQGFEEGRKIPLLLQPLYRVYREAGAFSQEIYERISNRASHLVWGVAPNFPLSDFDRIAKTIQILKNATSPTFIHLHLMGTHCCDWVEDDASFSMASMRESEKPVDIYDRSILQADLQLGRLLDYLDKTKAWENTLLVVYSDHGFYWTAQNRVPLIFVFPQTEKNGSVASNVELIDLAPTVLDYLGIQKPLWMQGNSLWKEEKKSNGVVYSAILSMDSQPTAQASKPLPRFGLKGLSIVTCDDWVYFNAFTGKTSAGKVSGHTRPCRVKTEIALENGKQLIHEHLKANGFYPQDLAKNSN